MHAHEEIARKEIQLECTSSTKHVAAYVYMWNRREPGGEGRNWKYTSSHDVEEHTQTVE